MREIFEHECSPSPAHSSKQTARRRNREIGQYMAVHFDLALECSRKTAGRRDFQLSDGSFVNQWLGTSAGPICSTLSRIRVVVPTSILTTWYGDDSLSNMTQHRSRPLTGTRRIEPSRIIITFSGKNIIGSDSVWGSFRIALSHVLAMLTGCRADKTHELRRQDSTR